MSEPQKAKFQRLASDLQTVEDELTVEISPTEFTLNKGAQIAEVVIPGLDMPILQFVRGQTETLSVDVFFDTTDYGMGEGAYSVTEETDGFYQLIRIDPTTHAPPICRFIWGGTNFPGSKYEERWATQSRVDGFQCIVESVRQRFTLFSPEGVPLRAILTLTLREYRTLRQQIDEIRFETSNHTRSHTVQRGETLMRVANEAYGDPGKWRPIAIRNGLIDPLDLSPGTVLEIPPLR